MPATVNSLYEQLFPLTTVMGQRVVETFSGDSLNTDRWTHTDLVGTKSYAMADAVNGGLEMTSATTTNDRHVLWFNGKNQYAHDGSVAIFVMERTSAVGTINVGFSEDATGATDDCQVRNHAGITYYDLITTGSSSTTEISSSIANDTTRRVVKLENLGASTILYIDGVSEATSTTNLPSIALSPFVYHQTTAASAATAQISYCEAYNT
jgi:hypothetical protein